MADVLVSKRSLKRAVQLSLCAAVLAASGGAALAQSPLDTAAGATNSITQPGTTSSGNGVTSTVAGTLNVGDGTATPDAVTALALAALNITSSGTVNIATDGLLRTGGGRVQAILTNDGMLANSGSIELKSAASTDGSNNQWVNNGRFINNTGARFSVFQSGNLNALINSSSGTMRNAGNMTLFALLLGTTRLLNSGAYTLLEGGEIYLSTAITEGFTTLAGGTTLIQATDGKGYIFGSVATDSGGTLQLDPAAGRVQSFSGIGNDTGNFPNLAGGTAKLSGVGEVQKTSAGTTVFYGPFDYTGPTTVKGGSLVLVNNGDIHLSTTTVQTGATLGGNGTAGPTTVQAGGTLKPGTGATSADTDAIATLKVQGDLALDASSISLFKLTAPDKPAPEAGVATPNGDVVAVTGALSLFGTIKPVPQTNLVTGAYKIITYAPGQLTKSAKMLKAATVDNSDVALSGFYLSVDDTTVPGEVWLVVAAMKPQVITYQSTAPAGATAGGTYQAAATSDSGLPVALSSSTPLVCTIDSQGLVTFVSAGDCILLADQAGNSEFYPATQVPQTFPVVAATVPVPQTITYTSTPPASAVVGTPYTAVATATSTLPVTLTSLTTSVCTVDATGVVTIVATGTCTLAANQPGNSSFLPAAQVLQSFNVGSVPVPVVATPVPTLSTVALALLGLFAAALGAPALRRRKA